MRRRLFTLLEYSRLFAHVLSALVTQWRPASIAGAGSIVYNCTWAYTLGIAMNRAALTRTNLLLEVGKIRRLRKALQSRSNSEAVRRVVDERLAVETGLEALRSLRKLGGPEDVFGRAPAKKR